MTIRSFLRAGAFFAVCWLALVFVPAAYAPVQAQTSVSVEFRTALEPHGRWLRHSRWGEVWRPADVDRNWRPYTVGRWVYTDDWGWYWVSDDAEAAWGWVAFHYGRWVFDRELGWVWVPGREWGPAWVNWRRGHQHVGWAPLPPDEIVVEYNDEPDVWIFVRPRDFIAPRVVRVMLPFRERDVFIRETMVVNRTVIVRDRGPVIAVNPGIEPAIIAAAVGRPLRTHEVRPRVLAGTAKIEGAVEVTAKDLRERRRTDVSRVTVRETSSEIRPAAKVPEPKPLAKTEQGRLGDNPPRAARAAPDDQKKPDAQRDRKEPAAAQDERDRKAREAERDQKEQKAREAEREAKDRKAREAERDQKEQKAREAEREAKDRKAREAERAEKAQKAKGREAERDQQLKARQEREQKAREVDRREQQQKARGAEREQIDRKARETTREPRDVRDRRPATEGRAPPPERAAPQRPEPAARPQQERRGPAAGPRSEGPARSGPPAAAQKQKGPEGPSAVPAAPGRGGPAGGAPQRGGPGKKED